MGKGAEGRARKDRRELRSWEVWGQKYVSSVGG